jgi:hypothetical protein
MSTCHQVLFWQGLLNYEAYFVSPVEFIEEKNASNDAADTVGH